MAADQSFDLVVEPDFGQFYMRRSGAEWASDQVPSVGYERSLWTNGSFVYVGTDRKWGSTHVRVEVLDGPPMPLPGAQWQHVAETSLDPGGDLEVFDWPGDAPNATVPIDPGSVRVRVHWTGLVPDRFEGMDDDCHSDESLLMEIWPEPPAETTVIRWWEQWVLPALTDRSPDGRRQTEGLEAVLERWGALEVICRLEHPYPRMPGGGEYSSVNSVVIDRADGTWWADGYDVRRTLREITKEEADDLRDWPN